MSIDKYRKYKKKVYGGRRGYSCQAQFNEAGLAIPRLYFTDLHRNWQSQQSSADTNWSFLKVI